MQLKRGEYLQMATRHTWTDIEWDARWLDAHWECSKGGCMMGGLIRAFGHALMQMTILGPSKDIGRTRMQRSHWACIMGWQVSGMKKFGGRGMQWAGRIASLTARQRPPPP